MSETAILATVVTALWGLVVGLLGVVWSTLKERNSAQGVAIERLQEQNTVQETAIGRLTERAIAREEAHAQHREDTQAQFSRIDLNLSEMNRKLDTLLRGSGGRGGTGSQGSPYPPIPRVDPR